jgi:hypothetical protein
VFGGLALGGWLWGVVADHYGVPTSLLAAGLGSLATALLGRVLPMPATDRVNVEPAPPTRRARAGPSLDLDSGPVVASTEYRIAPRDVRAFLLAARRLKRMRGRNGARRWALLHDAADPEVWVERFETPTWLDHLRVRDRMTVTDREVEDEVLAFHGGDRPPATRHLLAHVPLAEQGDDVPEDAGRRGAIFDPSLPPTLSEGRRAA